MSILRDITFQSQKYFDRDEILLFIGARQAGKTTILRQHEITLKNASKATFFLNMEDPEYLRLLNDHPKNIFDIFPINLKEKTFLFLDEVQYLKNPSNFLKYLYDEYKGKIQIIASGSSAFYIDETFKDSLAGRKKIFHVYTLSFRELLRFKNENVLASKNFKTLTISEKDTLKKYYQEFLTFGGYPAVVLAEISEKKEILREIVYSYIKKDVFEAKLRREDIFYLLLKLLASQIGQLVNMFELAHTLGVSKTAIERYLHVMQKSFHLQLIKPFYRNVRKELTKMPKCYFFDLGLRNFLMDNFETFQKRNDKGALLENAVFRQLIEKYWNDEIRFWRTTSGQEIDFIIDGKHAIEVKINPKQWKPSKYKKFFENYPSMDFRIATFDSGEKIREGKKVEVAWNILENL